MTNALGYQSNSKVTNPNKKPEFLESGLKGVH
jgi:hypothetical protein